MSLAFAAESRDDKVLSLTYKIKTNILSSKVETDTRRLFLTLAEGPRQVTAATPIAPSTAITPYSKALVEGWMQTCRKHHVACRREPTLTTGRRFARILDVGDLAAESLHLVSLEHLPRNVTYMTLSHCWGGSASSIPSLSMSRLAQYLRAISFETLPRTFQDAVRATRALGVRYLWIDSLCIIQDSKEDWLDQAATMGQTYQGSYLNLAATRSVDAHGGLFTSRYPAAIAPLRIPIEVLVRREVNDASTADKYVDFLRTEVHRKNFLRLYYRDPEGECYRTINLNDYLGNNDGVFDEQGKTFSQSASHIRLYNDWILTALLKRINGRLKAGRIDLHNIIERIDVFSLPLTVCRYEREWYDVDAASFTKWSQISSAKLCNRGWVIQERLLAPRIIHFGEDQLFWECVEMQAYEEHPEPLSIRRQMAKVGKMDFKGQDPFSVNVLQDPKVKELRPSYLWSSAKAMHKPYRLQFSRRDLLDDRHGTFIRHATTLCYSSDRWMATHALINLWSAITSAYMEAQLTCVEDRLIAISGIARILHDRTGIQYVAGLWACQLPRQLLWSCRLPREAREPDMYVAPSWSWASAPIGATEFDMLLNPSLEAKGAMDLIEIVSTQLNGIERHQDGLSALEGGSLIIRGRLLPFTIDTSAWPAGRYAAELLVSNWTGSTTRVPTRSCFILPVLFVRWQRHLPKSTFNSLILEATGIKGVFVRVGQAYLQHIYPLSEVVLPLDTARASYHVDSDDEAEEEEVQDEISPTDPTLPLPSDPTTLSPEQIIHTKFKHLANQPDFASVLRRAREDFGIVGYNAFWPEQPSQQSEFLATMQNFQAHQPYERQDDPFKYDNTRMYPSEPGTSNFAFTITPNLKLRAANPIPDHCTKVPPRAAVGEESYLEYLEDAKSRKLGNFVFALI